MKTWLIIVSGLLMAAAINADPEDVYIDLMKDQLIHCGKKNGLTEKTPKEIFYKEMERGEEKASCLVECTMKLRSFIKDSKINLDNVQEFLKIVHADEPDLLKQKQKAAVDCFDKVKDIDGCKMAFSYVKCFMEN